ncbi:MAG: FAD-binding oxidoreductase [Saprospiraceae bacterium]|nr:FAD-binding oxidoreductase [Saprospiraceae bacterium]
MDSLSKLDYSGLEKNLIGIICLPDDSGYFETIEVFNALVVARPKLVVFPKVPHDIKLTILFAKENGLKITVKNGGHSTYGQCLNDGGIVVDMKFLNQVEVDPSKNVARVQAGALMQDLDAATTPYHLAVPGGDCPMVGVTGLVLGGGNGFLSRSFGLTCDQLISAILVAANGETLALDRHTNPNIFQAIRGAGQSNFGVITEVVLKLSVVPPKIYGGSSFWPIDRAREIFRKYYEMISGAPDELSLYLRLNQDFKGEPVIRLYGMYNGPIDTGKMYFDRISRWAGSLSESFGEYTYFEMQRINEQPAQFRPKFYWKTFFIDEPDDLLIEELLVCFQERPTQHCRINLDVLGGQIQRISPLETSFVHRNDHFICSIIAVFENPADEYACKNWCFGSWQKLRTGSDRSYQNYADPYLADPPRSYFDTKLDQMLQLKQTFDPENIFIGSLSKRKIE